LSANAAAWIQAGGAIAAIAGAIWLSRRETIIHRRERRALGEEVAWAVRFALTNAQLEARTIAAKLVDEYLLNKENPERHWMLRTKNCRNVLQIFAQRLDHIHPVANHIASNGALLLRQMDEDLKQALVAINEGKRPSIPIVTDIVSYEAHFERLLSLFDDRMRRVSKALDEGGDILPVREFKHRDIPP
jgi:hypothetical protein